MWNKSFWRRFLQEERYCQFMLSIHRFSKISLCIKLYIFVFYFILMIKSPDNVCLGLMRASAYTLRLHLRYRYDLLVILQAVNSIEATFVLIYFSFYICLSCGIYQTVWTFYYRWHNERSIFSLLLIFIILFKRFYDDKEDIFNFMYVPIGFSIQ